MALLLIGFGGGVVVGFVLCAIRAGQQFDEGYRCGMDAGQGVRRMDMARMARRRRTRSEFEVVDCAMTGDRHEM